MLPETFVGKVTSPAGIPPAESYPASVAVPSPFVEIFQMIFSGRASEEELELLELLEELFELDEEDELELDELLELELGRELLDEDELSG